MILIFYHEFCNAGRGSRLLARKLSNDQDDEDARVHELSHNLLELLEFS